ncbi:MAG TPA: GNAT family N-acetyltransferase [Thermoanaerobaculia bacterium]|nr:GNAT family N-acetyltransferase [Thermoanaerobaculia bacterium]
MTHAVWTVRRLLPADAGAFVRLRGEALDGAPFAFEASPEDDFAGSEEFVRDAFAKTDQVIVGAFEPELAGVVGVFRERSRKAAHKARLWGLYVRPEFRRIGLGLILVRQAIEFARSLEGVASLDLCVAEKASAATAFYQRLGFRVWGVEPAALRVGGEDLAERHMRLELSGPAGGSGA